MITRDTIKTIMEPMVMIRIKDTMTMIIMMIQAIIMKILPK